MFRNSITNLCRISSLVLPSGAELQTPLMIPSLSSRGFSQPALRAAAEVALGRVEETVLVSAYDLYYGLVPSPGSFRAELLFIDSGGYECETPREEQRTRGWSVSQLETVLDAIPEEIDAAIVNLDSRKPFPKQLKEAKFFFNRYPQHLHDFLVKPESHSKLLEPDVLASLESGCDVFSFIGFTEKELGHSLIDRLTNLVSIRLTLDRIGIRAPIHVFGALDPVVCPLYFMAGAEVFDGLTWCRYWYYEGQALYQQHYAPITEELEASDDEIWISALVENIANLRVLELEMAEFFRTGSFAVFGARGSVLNRVMDAVAEKRR